ncbi:MULTISPECIES: OsmC family protein [Clostridium]|uniref:Conserved protein with a OsmC domain n=4 Tax=Clostridium TaxID=1485 RepID=D8GNY5_CLOLD|nr:MULTISPECIES: OsmC family protein [Clostridium]ADK13831.1 conserved protein with a OsmC domain [Clostridium ljungdahlii DSM 13528]AGY77061.1 OsmC family protein [Clostridium autoethanogenum DSM 10061]ALU37202.1 OsmC family protein [Clostridium autoethanogenum DSM 10061]OAA84069.1 hypothetical protein WX73_03533 [Clostridium coskatii]OAA87318.1 hypothetical protein WX45_03438 [Clostridium ljungdahlii DSM 13528]
MLTLKCNAKLDGTFKVCAKVGNHEYIMDHSIENGGKDEGAIPGQMLLVALAGCKLMVISSYAQKRRITLEECEAQITGDFDEIKNGIGLNIKVDILVKTDADDKEIKKMNDFVDKNCSIAAILSQPNIVEGQIKRKK